MRIKSKLLAIYIPILLIGMALTGYWAYLSAYESVREKEYQLLTQTLSLSFFDLVDERHKLLLQSGLENVPVFRDAYQKEVFAELDTLSETTGKEFTISDYSTGEKLYSTLASWSAVNLENANHTSINGKDVAFGETILNGDEALFACGVFVPWNWKLTVSQPATELEASLSKIALFTVLTTLFAVALVSVLMGTVTQLFVIAPINKIKSATSKIASNHSKVDIAVSGKNELSELARDVEFMSGEIVEYVSKAQAANKAKTDFLAVMSHEMRTPLNGIQGLASLLLATELTEKQQKYATDLKASASILANVINDVLDLSKIESGMTEIDLTEFDLDSMLRDLVTLLGTNASVNNTRLEYKSRNLASVLVISDITKIRQIVINLISNAIKFTHQGTVTINAKLKHVSTKETQDNRLVITVKDTGIGIEADRLESIFDKFTQSDSSISRRYGGTGLGLAIARELAQLLGGDIKVTSKIGEGSCFTVTADVRSRVSHLESVNVNGTEKSTVAKLKKGMNVLLAEDNAINAVVAKALLEQLGCVVIHVDNGLKAAARVEEGGIDLVFMDIHMPVMDGVEATQRIRKLESPCKNVPIIGLTAEAFKDRHEAFMQAGMQDVVTKPVTIEALEASMISLQERQN